MLKKILGVLLLVIAAEGAAIAALRANLRVSIYSPPLRAAPALAEGNYSPGWPEPRLPKIKITDWAAGIDPDTIAGWQLTGPATLASENVTDLNPWTRASGPAKVWGRAINEPALGKYLLALAQIEDQDPKNAQLEIVGDRAVKFSPELEGRDLDLGKLRAQIVTALTSGQDLETSLPVKKTGAAVKLRDLNQLGINELLARGQSDFHGSSASRIKNIQVGSSRYQGLIIPAGTEFSFNKVLGSVDAEHGFLPELVIKQNGTVPEFGGGLCQVSSTAFRAAFFSGLPITARKNHSYAVKYYEWISDDVPRAVGLDATIYPGVQDLKFINDTGGAILVSTAIKGTRLYFDFYGTADGRAVKVDGPHPYDRKPSGAVKSTVTRVVTKNGDRREETFPSNYVSPLLFPKIYEYPPPAKTSEGSLGGPAPQPL